MNSIFVTKKLMRVTWLTLALALIAGQAVAQDPPALTSDKDKLSYALGMDLGNQLRRLSVDVDAAVFGTALADALAGGKTLMTPDQARAQIAALQAEMRRRQAEVHALSRDHSSTEATGPATPPGAGEAKTDLVKPQ